MSRKLILEDAPKVETLPRRWDKIVVPVSVVYSRSTGNGWCHPKSFDDNQVVLDKIANIGEGMPGEYAGFVLQVHLEKNGLTVWAQGTTDEAFIDVARRAERIWLATSIAWEFEHRSIL